MHPSSVPCLIHFSFVLCLMYFLSLVFRVSFIPCSISFASHLVWYLICFMSRLRSCLNSCLDSSHVLQSVMRNKDWDRRQLEEQDVYRESIHPVFCWVIRSVTYEISYIQPIHWWRFSLYLLTRTSHTDWRGSYDISTSYSDAERGGHASTSTSSINVQAERLG